MLTITRSPNAAMTAHRPARRLSLAALFAAACCGAFASSAAAQQPPQPVLTAPSQTPAAPHDQLLALLWMQRAAEYKAACQQSYNVAMLQLRSAVEDPTWTACLEQGLPDSYGALPPAVVVDVDETILDNSAFAARQVRAGVLKFDAVAWRSWVHEQQALPIPGALAYLTAATQLGVRVVYITNRKTDSDKDGVKITEESDTRSNLARLGFPIIEGDGEDLVLTQGEIGDKSARRRAVCQHYRVVQLIGDNLGDFTSGTEPRKVEAPQTQSGENAATERARDAIVVDFANWWGTRWILIPNPTYGGWETVLRGQHETLQDALRLQK